MEALIEDYDSVKEALNGIESTIREFYSEDYPDLYSEQREIVEQAIQTLQQIYEKNFFPWMKVRWDTYVDNIGHLDSAGCFRCHDERHVSAEGEAISMECHLCHIIMAQGPDFERAPVPLPEGLEYVHPEDVDKEEWEDGKCWNCHTGEYAGF